MEEVPENTTVNQKALRWVTILCPCAMVGVWLVGVGIWALWSDVLDHSTMVVKPCGEIMLNCLYFGFGLCSALYLPGDKKNGRHRLGAWFTLQVVGAWVFAMTAATLAHLNDGMGIGVVFLAPLITLPSFLVGLVAYFALRGEVGDRFCLRARSLCLLILLGIMGAMVWKYSYGVYCEWTERNNPPAVQRY